MRIRHPQLGDVEVEWDFEPHTNASVGTTQSVTSSEGRIVWYMPDRDYTWFDEAVNESDEMRQRYAELGQE